MQKLKISAIALALFSNVALANGTYDMAINDGCISGKRDAGQTWRQFTKDVDKYIADPYHKNGWDDGYRQCKADLDNINKAVDDAFNIR
jgi:Holliday junction resolvase RusA-like endonuclease